MRRRFTVRGKRGRGLVIRALAGVIAVAILVVLAVGLLVSWNQGNADELGDKDGDLLLERDAPVPDQFNNLKETRPPFPEELLSGAADALLTRPRKQGDAAYIDLDDMDVRPPRADEEFIPFSDFVQCLAKALRLDVKQKKEFPFPQPLAPPDPAASRDPVVASAPVHESTLVIPHLTQHVSIEIADIKQFACSLNVSVRHWVYVRGGNAPEMRLYMEALESIFGGWTSRLKVIQHEALISSAAAINTGMRDALDHCSVEEVPFMFVTQPDIRIPDETLRGYLPEIYEYVSFDSARLAELRAEVSAESATDAWRTPSTGRQVADGQGLLVTSPLLPQRIRNMPVEEQSRAFQKHFALFYLNTGDGPGSMSSFFVSRLAVSVGGYWDENFFPDFFDDPDIRWRFHDLGFSSLRVSMLLPAVTFYDDTFLNYDRDLEEDREERQDRRRNLLGGAPILRPRRRRRELSREAQTYRRQIVSAFGDGYSWSYASWKWSVVAPVVFQGPFGDLPVYEDVNRDVPAARKIPLDAWVLDERRLTALQRRMNKKTSGDSKATRYDFSLIGRAGFL